MVDTLPLIYDSRPVLLFKQYELRFRVLYTGVVGHTVQIAKKFEFLLDAYRHPNGQPWKGQEIDKATGGVVT
jgi:hypothetical protein